MTVPSSSSLPDFLSEPSFTTIKQAFPVITTISLAIVALISFVVFTQRSKYPIANAPAWLELTTLRRMKYMKDGHTVLDNALKQYGEKPFKLLTNSGMVTVFPPEYANMIRNERQLVFAKAFAHDFAAKMPGLEPFNFLDLPDRVIQTVSKKQLTKSLNIMTQPLSNESILQSTRYLAITQNGKRSS